MKVTELAKKLYDEYKICQDGIFSQVSELLEGLKKRHEEDCRVAKKDPGQSWRIVKGKALERFLRCVVKDKLRKLNICVIDGSRLEHAKSLNPVEKEVKQQISVDYGNSGFHLPDSDMVLYRCNSGRIHVLAILSCKVTLRERIAQTGYWKGKLSKCERTNHIKMFFVTPDEDKTLRGGMNKSRAIVEKDTDGAYILASGNFERNAKIKEFPELFRDIERLLNNP
jgi:type II restriction enzyme